LKEPLEDPSLKVAQSDWDAWEEEIVADMKAGVLDEMIAEAKQEYLDRKVKIVVQRRKP
jgi:hypothetical protein